MCDPPHSVCDLQHRQARAAIVVGENERSPKYGIIIRIYFPKERATRCHHTKAWLTRQHMPVVLTARQRFRPPDPTNFRCETGQWPGSNGSDSVPKDTKPKGFPT